MRRLVIVCLAVTAGVVGGHWFVAPSPVRADVRDVVLIGDSITYGTARFGKNHQSPYNPGAVLEGLLQRVEPPPVRGGTKWRGARVHNLAIGATATTHWLLSPPYGCESFLELYPVIKAACAHGVSFLEAVPYALKGRKADAIIVALGVNDRLVTSDPSVTVDNLERIRRRFEPIPVLLFPPISPPAGVAGEWTKRVREEMATRGLLPAGYPEELPTYDGLHLTDGGYAALAALWLDHLRALP